MTSYNHKFLTDAIKNLAPGCKWIVRDGELEWIDDEELKPSDEQIEAKVQEIEAEEPKRILRLHRDRLLLETDWVVAKYTEIGEPIPSQWVEYRQALRDLPNTTTPVLDPSGFLGISSIDWPVKP